MRSLGWAIIQCDQCPYKIGHQNRLTWRDDDTQLDASHLQATETGLEQIFPSQSSDETDPADPLILDFWPPER